MNQVNKVCVLFFILEFFFNYCYAGFVRIESENLTSIRRGDDLRFEMPIYNFMAATYNTDKRNLKINTNFGFFNDPFKQNFKFNLYIMDLSYTPIKDFLNFRIGRAFDSHRTIGSTTTDSIALEFVLLSNQLKLGSFAGVQRQIEAGNFYPNVQIRGAYFDFQTSQLFPLFITTKYQQKDYEQISQVPKKTEHAIQFTAQKSLPYAWAPELLLDSTTNIVENNLDRLEASIDLYPTIRTSSRWRLSTFNILPTTGIEQPIFSIFSIGRLYEALSQFEYRFSSSFLASVSFAYDDYLLQGVKRAHGYRTELEMKYLSPYGSIANTVYIFKSYGGSVYGDRIQLSRKIFDNFTFKQITDVTYYEKITSSKRFALNFNAGFEMWVWSNFRFDLSGEFNSNNILKYDARALLKITYLRWTDT